MGRVSIVGAFRRQCGLSLGAFISSSFTELAEVLSLSAGTCV